MSVRIRLSRVGKGAKKRPYFRVCVMDKHKSRDGKIIETLGMYDPAKDPAVFRVNKEKFDAWVKKGAEVSETVARMVKKTKI
ncbi:MAG: 30S ribosomal protein S16 [Candidatus Omnitrophica bacterium]|nr:30S ribosomal protein S16 [Candidatus Omnitrophota bacterium]MDD5236984.1 30S ribosomal protein S16 [Candidatus Omnitrophota bacterium]MDD5611261.1 30S ribosomal protein S16 [Candidatus Omnitrophota bacterium]